MHTVAVLALPDVVPFDLGVACDTFVRVRASHVEQAYRVRVCSEQPRVGGDLFELRPPFRLDALADADTIMVPGTSVPLAPTSRRVLDALRAAATRGRRIASICSGAFVLAEAGLLDGLRATTHWLAAAELARRYPTVDVDPNVLFVDNGRILTSAGAAAGLDLCLHMIQADYGAAVAVDAARNAVAPRVREGGQAQFIAPEWPAGGDGLHDLMDWLHANLRQPLTLDAIARKASTSVRTLTRRFQEQTGTSPGQWLQTARVRHAQQLLEVTELSIEHVATEAGFGSVSAFRERFSRIVGTSPQRYRQAFRTRADA
ncbi:MULTISPECIES: GlxA family transcriptional regulator [Burkholderia]|mgnify:FL=1|uniref:GlxA family transcriptional regulator n=1 Tax=Burkholderia TaxID=32008 RepID=UPI00067890D8|nr:MULTISPECIES: helix-turn-helix domain-containing protein [Burkholderia]KWU27326.1 AraC family transcriptional regulator [Burkholderia cenocepacia]OXI68798.1 AraC family transcriptional regulator [Burkholderia sp. AU31280]QRR16464.1 helix-turn-helix domain-containing protein [Burkholderia sp. MS389]QVN13971.1 helix-turn-helix domain-containing protein [Burkholderia sp. LAS2]RQV59387.1 AraC family transcriptional regulator [Burkholderia cenocepacia]